MSVRKKRLAKLIADMIKKEFLRIRKKQEKI